MSRWIIIGYRVLYISLPACAKEREIFFHPSNDGLETAAIKESLYDDVTNSAGIEYGKTRMQCAYSYVFELFFFFSHNACS